METRNNRLGQRLKKEVWQPAMTTHQEKRVGKECQMKVQAIRFQYAPTANLLGRCNRKRDTAAGRVRAIQNRVCAEIGCHIRGK
jgi:hypothetical protein